MKRMMLLLLLATMTQCVQAATTDSNLNLSVTVLPNNGRAFSVSVVVHRPGDIREWHCPNANVVENWDNITFTCHHQTFSSEYTFRLETNGAGSTLDGSSYQLDTQSQLLTFDYTKVLKGRWDLYLRPINVYYNSTIVYNGTIEDLVFYNTSISDKEIHALYRAGVGQ